MTEKTWWRGKCRSEHNNYLFLVLEETEEAARATVTENGYEVLEIVEFLEYVRPPGRKFSFASLPIGAKTWLRGDSRTIWKSVPE